MLTLGQLTYAQYVDLNITWIIPRSVKLAYIDTLLMKPNLKMMVGSQNMTDWLVISCKRHHKLLHLLIEIVEIVYD